MPRTEFERAINASDLQEWIMEAFPDWCKGDVRLIYDHIDDMPSAQPNVHDFPKDADCISRADALSCFHDWIDQRGDVHTADEMPEYQRIEQLPTADTDLSAYSDKLWKAAYERGKTEALPERTCVNCGRTANNGGWYADGRTRCPIEEHYALPKDGYCHLWEKRNVTDDDYPERREK